jgi:hypothetical protein
MTVASDGVYGNFLLDENTNFGFYNFVTYNLHHDIILSYKIKSHVLQFLEPNKSKQFEVLIFRIATDYVFFFWAVAHHRWMIDTKPLEAP